MFILFPVYNHFEIKIIDEFGSGRRPPPMIALTAAQVKDIVDSRRLSNFRLDFLRFWATGEGLKTFSVIRNLILKLDW